MKEINKEKEAIYRGRKYVLYEPTPDQLKLIRAMISDSTQLDSNLRATGNYGESIVRFLLKELTNIGDDIETKTAQEINEMFEGSLELQRLRNELECFVREIVSLLQSDIKNYVGMLGDMADAIMLEKEALNSKEKMNELLAKLNSSASMEEIETEIESRLIIEQELLKERELELQKELEKTENNKDKI